MTDELINFRFLVNVKPCHVWVPNPLQPRRCTVKTGSVHPSVHHTRLCKTKFMSPILPVFSNNNIYLKPALKLPYNQNRLWLLYLVCTALLKVCPKTAQRGGEGRGREGLCRHRRQDLPEALLQPLGGRLVFVPVLLTCARGTKLFTLNKGLLNVLSFFFFPFGALHTFWVCFTGIQDEKSRVKLLVQCGPSKKNKAL